EHQRFWRQMILWLARKDQEGDEGVWARVEPRNFAPKQKVNVTFGARDNKGGPLADTQFQVEGRKPGGEVQPRAPQREGTVDSAQLTDTATPGDYWVRVQASQKGVPLGSEGWTRFIVDARDFELDNPAADLGLMQEIAQLTGGYSFPPEKFGE